MGSSYPRAKGRRSTSQFVALDYHLLASPAWNDLSLRARDTFVRLHTKYNGHNNGDLSITISELRSLGELKSPASLSRALDQLWSHGFILLTRQGHFGSARLCNLWAVTTRKIDDNSKKGIRGTDKPSNDWRDWSPDTPGRDFAAKYPAIAAKRQSSAKHRGMAKNKTPVQKDDLTGTYG